MAIKGYLARVKVSGSPVAMTAEATTATGNQVYQITNAAKRVLPYSNSITVKVGGVATTTGFTINRLNGKITFDTVLVRTVTVDGFYLPTTVAAEAKEFSVTLNTDILDATKFTSGGYKESAAGLNSAEGSISEFFSLDRYFEDSLVAGSPIVVELYPDGTNPISMFAYVTSSEIGGAVADLVEESISFESTGVGNIAYI